MWAVLDITLVDNGDGDEDVEDDVNIVTLDDFVIGNDVGSDVSGFWRAVVCFFILLLCCTHLAQEPHLKCSGVR